MNSAAILAKVIEDRMDEQCPAVQGAIDALVEVHRPVRGRQGLLECLPKFTDQDLLDSLLYHWKPADLLRATGRDRDQWISILNAMGRRHSA